MFLRHCRNLEYSKSNALLVLFFWRKTDYKKEYINDCTLTQMFSSFTRYLYMHITFSKIMKVTVAIVKTEREREREKELYNNL